MSDPVKEAAKLLKTFCKVQRGVLYSQRYTRLFNSHIKSVAIHEAAHAVVATLLGVRVAMAEVEVEMEEFSGGRGITSGRMIMEPEDVKRLSTNYSGKLTLAAIIMASAIADRYKFEWEVEKYLVEVGYDGDKAMAYKLQGDDKSFSIHAGCLLAWLSSQPKVLNAIEAVAEVLNEKKMVLGAEIRQIVANSGIQATEAFTRKQPSKGKKFVDALVSEKECFKIRRCETFSEDGVELTSEPKGAEFTFLDTNYYISVAFAKDPEGEVFLVYLVDTPGAFELVNEPEN